MLLDSLLSFCQTKQPDVLDTQRKHVSFKRLNNAINQANSLILPLFQGSGDSNQIAQDIAKQLRSVVYKPWLQIVTNHYAVQKIQRKRENKWNQK